MRQPNLLDARVIFCAWTDSNPMSPKRSQALFSIFSRTGCPVAFLTSQTYKAWEVSGQPMHPAYDFLSATHKADYLRMYLMHHYGGGYTDIKHTAKDWNPFFA